MILHKPKCFKTNEKKKKSFADELSERVEQELNYHEQKEIEKKSKKRMTDDDMIKKGDSLGIDWNNTKEVMARLDTYQARAYRLQGKIKINKRETHT